MQALAEYQRMIITAFQEVENALIAVLSLAETRRIQLGSVVQLYKAFGGWPPEARGEAESTSGS